MQENNQNTQEDNKNEPNLEESMEKSNSGSKALVISLIVIIIILFAGGGYFFYNLSSKITDLETDLNDKDQKVEKQVDDQKDEDNNVVKDDEEVKVPEEEEEDEPKEEPVKPKEIEYYNSDYGFGFTFPSTWKGYRVTEKDTKWDDFTATSLSFGFDAQEGLFAVSVFTHEQWDKLKDLSPEQRQVGYLGENSQYVFAWSRAQYIENSEMEKRINEISDIIKTFFTDAK